MWNQLSGSSGITDIIRVTSQVFPYRAQSRRAAEKPYKTSEVKICIISWNGNQEFETLRRARMRIFHFPGKEISFKCRAELWFIGSVTDFFTEKSCQNFPSFENHNTVYLKTNFWGSVNQTCLVIELLTNFFAELQQFLGLTHLWVTSRRQQLSLQDYRPRAQRCEIFFE